MLEQAHASPGRPDRAGDEQTHAQHGLREAVGGRDGCLEERAPAEEREGGVDEGEEAGDGGEGVEVVGEVCAEAGGVRGVEERAGEVFDGGVGGPSDGGYAGKGGGKGGFCGEEDGGGEDSVS